MIDFIEDEETFYEDVEEDEWDELRKDDALRRARDLKSEQERGY